MAADINKHCISKGNPLYYNAITPGNVISKKKVSKYKWFHLFYESSIKIIAFLLMLTLCFVSKTYAAKDPEVFVEFDGFTSGIFVGAEKEVKDPVYYTSQQQYIDDVTKDKYVNTIALFINESGIAFMQSDFTCKITIEFTYEDVAGQAHAPQSIDLIVTYKLGQGIKYDARQYYYFYDARKVNVKITAIDNYNASWDILKVLRLESRLSATRDYKFNCTASVNYDNISATADQVDVKWLFPSENGATHFDLEWAWIYDEAADLYKSMVNGQLQFDEKLIFRKNASRVTLVKGPNNYAIPLLYDGNGKLFYRVRPVQYRENGDLVEGKWVSINEATGVGIYVFEGHENNQFNWQATTSFAEEGKRKSVIQYFDGTLRSRQTVTKDNSTPDKNTVVAETFYDYQGRPTINVLPAPTINTVISYARDFNKFESSSFSPDPKELYDETVLNQNACNNGAPPLSNAKGAAYYYSSNNNLGISSINNFDKYIPDAQKYPYTETRYSQDATGRVTEQSGVGPDHKLGSGHQTKYYYGSPDQKELDALFGLEAGYASHYFKNMVKDANGQLSVSYIDMHGRTIATALAGEPPINNSVTGLNSYLPNERIVKNLLTPDNNIVQGRAVVSSTSLLVAKNGIHNFNYSVSPLSAEIRACNPPPPPGQLGELICYDCYYNLEIKIVDACGTLIHTEKRDNLTFSYNEPVFDQNCGVLPASIIVTFDYPLAEGEYNIIKILSVNKQAQDWYKEYVFKSKNICKTLQYFYNETYQVLVSQSDCETMTCTSCHNAVGSQLAYRTRFLQSQGLQTSVTYSNDLEIEIAQSWKEAYERCDILCNKRETQLDIHRQQMIQDMTPPLGQYARRMVDFTDDGDFEDIDPDSQMPEDPSNLPYNIFDGTYAHLNPMLQNKPSPYFKYPIDESDNTAIYKTALKTMDAMAYTADGLVVEPTVFSENFSGEWANSLLYYHPEYPKLNYAENNLKSSYDYDAVLDEITTWQGAYSNYIQLNKIIENDPFFIGVGAGYKAEMLGNMNVEYYNGSFWKLAYMTIVCPSNNTIECRNTAPSTYNSSLITGRCEADRNNIWRIFKTLYLTIKNDMVNRHMNSLIPDHVYESLKTHNYERRFGTVADYSSGNNLMNTILSDGGNAASLSLEMTQQQYIDNCESYKAYWKNELNKCEAIRDNTDLKDQILEQLKQICIEGSDLQHPFGSSSKKPTSLYSPADFETAIKTILQNKSIEITGLCHPFMITYPRPYDMQPALGNGLAVNQMDNCLCEKINDIKAAMNYSGTNLPQEMSNYLRSIYQLDVTPALLSTLINGCKGSSATCRTYDPPLDLPAFLTDCKPLRKNCIECYEYKAFKEKFIAKYPAFKGIIFSTPSTPVLTPEQIQFNEGFADFMNTVTGFNKRWEEYLIFEKNCGLVSNSWDCDILTGIENNFRSDPNNPSSGTSCQTAFAAVFNNIYNTFYNYLDIVNIYKINCSKTLSVCQSVLTPTDIEKLAKEFYNLHGPNYWQQNPSWDTSFIQLFNSKFNTDYDYDQVFNAVVSLCGNNFSICGRYSYPRLLAIDSAYKSNAGNPGWTSEYCEETFSIYFNIQTQSNLSKEEISELYAFQNLSVKACSPPVDCAVLAQIDENYKNIKGEACPQLNEQSPGYCNDCYTYFFNQQLNSSYTYEELVFLHTSLCKEIEFTSCETNLNCEILTDFYNQFMELYAESIGGPTCRDFFVTKFNLHFAESAAINGNYSFNQVANLYLIHCGYEPSLCVPVAITSGDQLTVVYDQFKSLYPYPAGLFGLNCQEKFVEYFNLNFSTNYNFTEISNYFISLLGDMPAVCAVDSVSKLIDFRNYYIEKYADYYMPRLLSNDLFTELFNREFTPQDNYTWGNIEDIYLLAGLSLNIYGPDVTSTLSCNKLTGLVVAYRAFKYVAAISSGGNPGEEQTAGEAIAIDEEAEKSYFTGMFNLYFHANYTYEQIVEYANSTCQIEDFNPIGTPSEEYLPIVTVDDPVSNVTEAWYPRLCGRVGPHVFPIPEPPGKCDYLKDMALAIATEQYNAYVAQLYNSFDNTYLAKCLEAKDHETFTVSAPVAEYHYTLYYYDQAGNLVKTVPPEGVHPNFNETYLTNVHDARLNGLTTNLPALPQHTLVTQYRYNTLNQVVTQLTPDAGLSRFWYDKLGRLVISQNAKQQAVEKYSYTIYDDLGRIKEVGQKLSTTVMTQVKCQNQEELFNWIYDNAFNKEQVTRTTYDLPAPNINPPPNPAPLTQVNLRNRVSFTQVFDEDPDNIADPPGIPNYLSHKSATYYSYDIHGNVDKLLQDYVGTMGAAAFPTGNRFKLITYNYDLISGKVNEVAYQPGMIDGFYHRYDYDAENRLTDVNTSRDGIYWEKDARYKYYRHGPLARSVLGEMQVQGLDYAYTLQGWLKGVNATTVLDGSKDIGLDGLVTGSGAPPQVARDIFGFSLNYFYGDYKPIILAVSGTFASVLPTGTDGLPATSSATDLMRTGHSLYNGNIASMVVNIPTMVGSTLTPGNPQVNGYRYDQLNRIVGMNTYTGLDNTTNIFTVPVNASVNYKERVIYDANGNILTYTRNGHTANTAGVNMDDLTYSYYAGTNKLKKVSDAIAPSNYADDIDDQAENENYEYDEIGNLIKDKAEGITNINWNVYGKISSITKFKNNVTTNIAYTYDASGNRISKDVNGAKTFYVRDASGNVMSLYTVESNINSGDLTQTEVHLFGSSRLGILNSNINVKNGLLAISNAGITTFTRGNKFFELSNHLGNVLVTVSDKKIAVAKSTPNQEEIDYYTADVITANDYYPGGMQMTGRKFSAGSEYRFGFNGKEKDDDTYGNGNEYDYGDRIYNPRIGRWLSLDPLQKKYPNETPYFYTGGNPILFADPDGRDRIITITLITDKGQYTLLQIRTDIGVYKKTMTSCYIWGDVKVIKENITESYTIDISKRTPSYNPPLISHTSTTEFVNSYLTNIVSYGLSKLGALDFNDPNAKAIPQNFGFVEVGGDGTTIELGGSDAKNKEVLDLSGILGAANASKDLGEGFPDLIELLRKVKGVSPITKLLLKEADAHEKMASAAEALDATMTSSPTTSTNNTKQGTNSNLKNAKILFCRDCNFPYEKNKKTSKWNISYTDKPVKDTGAGPDHSNPPVK